MAGTWARYHLSSLLVLIGTQYPTKPSITVCSYIFFRTRAYTFNTPWSKYFGNLQI